jgi:hypothetical protein
MLGTEERIFYNQVITKSTLQKLITKLVAYRGSLYTAHILDQIKTLGFHHSTKLGLYKIQNMKLNCLNSITVMVQFMSLND